MKSWHIKVCYFLDFQTMWCITISQKNLWLWALEILFFCLTLKMYSGIRLVHFERSEFWEFLKKNLNAQNVCTIYSQYILSVDRFSTLKRSDAQNVCTRSENCLHKLRQISVNNLVNWCMSRLISIPSMTWIYLQRSEIRLF